MEEKGLDYKGKVLPGNPQILGVTYTDSGTNFAVSISDGKEAYLVLYGENDKNIEIPLPLEERVGDVSAIRLDTDPFYGYNYRIDGTIVVDPYAKELLGRTQFGVHQEQYQEQYQERYQEHRIKGRLRSAPYQWKSPKNPPIPYEESVLYKVHVRGYTKNESSRVLQKGTFQGLKEKLSYLKKLGITTLELMPAYEFEELPVRRIEIMKHKFKSEEATRINFWGYTLGNYFAVKRSYAAGEEPGTEFKELIDALHSKQMECIMEFYFPKGVSQKLVLDVLCYWHLEYRIDGFHLLGEGLPVEAIVEEPLIKKSKLLFTNVDDGQIYGEKEPFFRNIGEYNRGFQDDLRRYLKGDEDFMNKVSYRLRRNPRNYGVINYISNNDGFTLADLVTYDEKHNESNGEENKDGTSYNYSWNCGVEGPSRKLTIRRLRLQQQKNAILFMMLSQGTPLLYGGDEFGNSTLGNNNPYCQDNEIGWVDWTMFARSKPLYQFVKQAIEFRKAHPILHQPKELRLMDYQSVGYPDLSYHSRKAWFGDFETTSRSLGMMYTGLYTNKNSGEPDDFIYVAYNMHWEAHGFALPHLPEGLVWAKAADTSENQGFYQEQTLLPDQRMVVAEQRSILILVSQAGTLKEVALAEKKRI